MMRRVAASVLLTTVLVLSGCGGATSRDVPQIVVTTNILGDVVQNVAGGTAEVTTLMKPGADPHSFEISAQEAARMQAADLLVSNGLGLEGGLQQNLDAATAAGVRSLVAGEHIDVLSYGPDEGGAVDPHFWTDPARMIDVVDAVEAALGKMPGVDAATVGRNADVYRNELTTLDTEMVQRLGAVPIENRALVTNHHVFGYLADRFGYRVIGAVIPGGTTLAAPSAADLSDLAAAVDEAGVRAIFAESSQPDRLVQVLAAEAGVDVAVVELFTESLTETGGGADTYVTMMRANTDRIAQGLTR